METGTIQGYHIHIYYAEAEGPVVARALRDALATRFEVELGMWRETAGGQRDRVADNRHPGEQQRPDAIAVEPGAGAGQLPRRWISPPFGPIG